MHQDWDTEFDGLADAADEFASTEPRTTVANVIGDLDVLLAGQGDDASLREILRSAGGYYDPVEPARVWLADLRARLARALAD